MQRDLKENGFTVLDAIALEDTSRIAETVARVVAEKPPYVVIGGGDGTISTALGPLAYTHIARGLPPMRAGRGEHHAQGAYRAGAARLDPAAA